MTLRNLISTFKYNNLVTISGNSCGWCNDELRMISMSRYNIPDVLTPWLDNEVLEVDIEKEYEGFANNYTAYFDIIIR